LSDEWRRRPWSEGPDEDAPPESWLLLDDDALLHRIETLETEHEEDERLIEVVASDRHFFIRQEAAKRVHDRSRLFVYEDDRHVGQILVRHLTRREDVTYLERLCERSTHVEVRSAAQVQIARLWHRLDARASGPATAPAPPPPPQAAAPEAPALPQQPAPSVPTEASHVAPAAAPAGRPPAAPAVTLAAAAVIPQPAAPAGPPAATQAPPAVAAEPVTSLALEKGGVDGSLLAWAAHFLVESCWSELGTQGTRELLTQTRRELLGRHPTLVYFEITPDAHVSANLDGGPRLPGDAVRAVAAWMVAFRTAAWQTAPELDRTSVRAATAMMADALRDAGFYTACDESEGELPF
jgi:hypothetical protein